METVRRGDEVLRCFCRGNPIFAVIGRTDKGTWFIHVKVYKAHQIYGEIVVTHGEARIRCRQCGRWHTIRIIEKKPQIKQEELPREFVG